MLTNNKKKFFRIKFNRKTKKFKSCVYNGCQLSVNSVYGIKALAPGVITIDQYNTLKRNVSKMCRSGSVQPAKYVWRLNSFQSLTRKSVESRMGKGKGSIYTYVAKLLKGQVIIEFCNIDDKLFNKIFIKFKSHMPISVGKAFKKYS